MTAADELAEQIAYALRRGYDPDEAIRIAHRELYGAPQEGRSRKEDENERHDH
jgi:hypothetical protein